MAWLLACVLCENTEACVWWLLTNPTPTLLLGGREPIASFYVYDTGIRDVAAAWANFDVYSRTLVILAWLMQVLGHATSSPS